MSTSTFNYTSNLNLNNQHFTTDTIQTVCGGCRHHHKQFKHTNFPTNYGKQRYTTYYACTLNNNFTHVSTNKKENIKEWLTLTIVENKNIYTIDYKIKFIVVNTTFKNDTCGLIKQQSGTTNFDNQEFVDKYPLVIAPTPIPKKTHIVDTSDDTKTFDQIPVSKKANRKRRKQVRFDLPSILMAQPKQDAVFVDECKLPFIIPEVTQPITINTIQDLIPVKNQLAHSYKQLTHYERHVLVMCIRHGCCSPIHTLHANRVALAWYRIEHSRIATEQLFFRTAMLDLRNPILEYLKGQFSTLGYINFIQNEYNNMYVSREDCTCDINQLIFTCTCKVKDYGVNHLTNNDVLSFKASHHSRESFQVIQYLYQRYTAEHGSSYMVANMTNITHKCLWDCPYDNIEQPLTTDEEIICSAPDYTYEREPSRYSFIMRRSNTITDVIIHPLNFLQPQQAERVTLREKITQDYIRDNTVEVESPTSEITDEKTVVAEGGFCWAKLQTLLKSHALLEPEVGVDVFYSLLRMFNMECQFKRGSGKMPYDFCQKWHDYCKATSCYLRLSKCGNRFHLEDARVGLSIDDKKEISSREFESFLVYSDVEVMRGFGRKRHAVLVKQLTGLNIPNDRIIDNTPIQSTASVITADDVPDSAYASMPPSLSLLINSYQTSKYSNQHQHMAFYCEPTFGITVTELNKVLKETVVGPWQNNEPDEHELELEEKYNFTFNDRYNNKRYVGGNDVVYDDEDGHTHTCPHCACAYTSFHTDLRLQHPEYLGDCPICDNSILPIIRNPPEEHSSTLRMPMPHEYFSCYNDDEIRIACKKAKIPFNGYESIEKGHVALLLKIFREEGTDDDDMILPILAHGKPIIEKPVEIVQKPTTSKPLGHVKIKPIFGTATPIESSMIESQEPFDSDDGVDFDEFNEELETIVGTDIDEMKHVIYSPIERKKYPQVIITVFSNPITVIQRLVVHKYIENEGDGNCLTEALTDNGINITNDQIDELIGNVYFLNRNEAAAIAIEFKFNLLIVDDESYFIYGNRSSSNYVSIIQMGVIGGDNHWQKCYATMHITDNRTLLVNEMLKNENTGQTCLAGMKFNDVLMARTIAEEMPCTGQNGNMVGHIDAFNADDVSNYMTNRNGLLVYSHPTGFGKTTSLFQWRNKSKMIIITPSRATIQGSCGYISKLHNVKVWGRAGSVDWPENVWKGKENQRFDADIILMTVNSAYEYLKHNIRKPFENREIWLDEFHEQTGEYYSVCKLLNNQVTGIMTATLDKEATVQASKFPTICVWQRGEPIVYECQDNTIYLCATTQRCNKLKAEINCKHANHAVMSKKNLNLQLNNASSYYATNCINTGVTVKDISTMIDTGDRLVMNLRDDWSTRITQQKSIYDIQIRNYTWHECMQSKGRVGRTQNGIFFGPLPVETYVLSNIEMIQYASKANEPCPDSLQTVVESLQNATKYVISDDMYQKHTEDFITGLEVINDLIDDCKAIKKYSPSYATHSDLIQNAVGLLLFNRGTKSKMTQKTTTYTPRGRSGVKICHNCKNYNNTAMQFCSKCIFNIDVVPHWQFNMTAIEPSSSNTKKTTAVVNSSQTDAQSGQQLLKAIACEAYNRVASVVNAMFTAMIYSKANPSVKFYQKIYIVTTDTLPQHKPNKDICLVQYRDRVSIEWRARSDIGKDKTVIKWFFHQNNIASDVATVCFAAIKDPRPISELFDKLKNSTLYSGPGGSGKTTKALADYPKARVISKQSLMLSKLRGRAITPTILYNNENPGTYIVDEATTFTIADLYLIDNEGRSFIFTGDTKQKGASRFTHSFVPNSFSDIIPFIGNQIEFNNCWRQGNASAAVLQHYYHDVVYKSQTDTGYKYKTIDRFHTNSIMQALNNLQVNVIICPTNRLAHTASLATPGWNILTTTIDKAQGLDWDHVVLLVDPATTMTIQDWYVALTRHKVSCTIITTKQGLASSGNTALTNITRAGLANVSAVTMNELLNLIKHEVHYAFTKCLEIGGTTIEFACVQVKFNENLSRLLCAVKPKLVEIFKSIKSVVNNRVIEITLMTPLTMLKMINFFFHHKRRAFNPINELEKLIVQCINEGKSLYKTLKVVIQQYNIYNGDVLVDAVMADDDYELMFDNPYNEYVNLHTMSNSNMVETIPLVEMTHEGKQLYDSIINDNINDEIPCITLTRAGFDKMLEPDVDVGFVNYIAFIMRLQLLNLEPFIEKTLDKISTIKASITAYITTMLNKLQCYMLNGRRVVAKAMISELFEYVTKVTNYSTIISLYKKILVNDMVVVKNVKNIIVKIISSIGHFFSNIKTSIKDCINHSLTTLKDVGNIALNICMTIDRFVNADLYQNNNNKNNGEDNIIDIESIKKQFETKDMFINEDGTLDIMCLLLNFEQRNYIPTINEWRLIDINLKEELNDSSSHTVNVAIQNLLREESKLMPIYADYTDSIEAHIAISVDGMNVVQVEYEINKIITTEPENISLLMNIVDSYLNGMVEKGCEPTSLYETIHSGYNNETFTSTNEGMIHPGFNMVKQVSESEVLMQEIQELAVDIVNTAPTYLDTIRDDKDEIDIRNIAHDKILFEMHSHVTASNNPMFIDFAVESLQQVIGDINDSESEDDISRAGMFIDKTMFENYYNQSIMTNPLFNISKIIMKKGVNFNNILEAVVETAGNKLALLNKMTFGTMPTIYAYIINYVGEVDIISPCVIDFFNTIAQYVIDAYRYLDEKVFGNTEELEMVINRPGRVANDSIVKCDICGSSTQQHFSRCPKVSKRATTYAVKKTTKGTHTRKADVEVVREDIEHKCPACKLFKYHYHDCTLNVGPNSDELMLPNNLHNWQLIIHAEQNSNLRKRWKHIIDDAILWNPKLSISQIKQGEEDMDDDEVLLNDKYFEKFIGEKLPKMPGASDYTTDYTMDSTIENLGFDHRNNHDLSTFVTDKDKINYLLYDKARETILVDKVTVPRPVIETIETNVMTRQHVINELITINENGDENGSVDDDIIHSSDDEYEAPNMLKPDILEAIINAGETIDSNTESTILSDSEDEEVTIKDVMGISFTLSPSTSDIENKLAVDAVKMEYVNQELNCNKHKKLKKMQNLGLSLETMLSAVTWQDKEHNKGTIKYIITFNVTKTDCSHTYNISMPGCQAYIDAQANIWIHESAGFIYKKAFASALSYLEKFLQTPEIKSYTEMDIDKGGPSRAGGIIDTKYIANINSFKKVIIRLAKFFRNILNDLIFTFYWKRLQLRKVNSSEHEVVEGEIFNCFTKDLRQLLADDDVLNNIRRKARSIMNVNSSTVLITTPKRFRLVYKNRIGTESEIMIQLIGTNLKLITCTNSQSNTNIFKSCVTYKLLGKTEEGDIYNPNWITPNYNRLYSQFNTRIKSVSNMTMSSIINEVDFDAMLNSNTQYADDLQTFIMAHGKHRVIDMFNSNIRHETLHKQAFITNFNAIYVIVTTEIETRLTNSKRIIQQIKPRMSDYSNIKGIIRAGKLDYKTKILLEQVDDIENYEFTEADMTLLASMPLLNIAEDIKVVNQSTEVMNKDPVLTDLMGLSDTIDGKTIIKPIAICMPSGGGKTTMAKYYGNYQDIDTLLDMDDFAQLSKLQMTQGWDSINEMYRAKVKVWHESSNRKNVILCHSPSQVNNITDNILIVIPTWKLLKPFSESNLAALKEQSIIYNSITADSHTEMYRKIDSYIRNHDVLSNDSITDDKSVIFNESSVLYEEDSATSQFYDELDTTSAITVRAPTEGVIAMYEYLQASTRTSKYTFNRFKPRLNRPASGKEPYALINSISGRLHAIDKLRTITPEPHEMYDKMAKSFFKENWKETIELFKEHKIYPTIDDSIEWLKKKGDIISKLKKIEDKMFKYESGYDFSRARGHFKQELLLKEQISSIQEQIGRIIVWHEQHISVVMCPLITKLKKRLVSIMDKRKFVYADGMSLRAINNSLQDIVGEHVVVELDLSKQDRQSDTVIQEEHLIVLRDLGLPEEYAEVMQAFARPFTLKTAEKTTTRRPAMHWSGGEMTSMGNQLRNMYLLADLYGDEEYIRIYTLGDDSLIICDEVPNEEFIRQTCASRHNVKCTFSYGNSGIFLQMPVGPDDDGRWLMTVNPFRLIDKLAFDYKDYSLSFASKSYSFMCMLGPSYQVNKTCREMSLPYVPSYGVSSQQQIQLLSRHFECDQLDIEMAIRELLVMIQYPRLKEINVKGWDLKNSKYKIKSPDEPIELFEPKFDRVTSASIKIQQRDKFIANYMEKNSLPFIPGNGRDQKINYIRNVIEKQKLT